MSIKRVSELEMLKIINDRNPAGLFYSKYDGMYTGCDNSKGEAHTEGFETLEDCKKWLKEITNK